MLKVFPYICPNIKTNRAMCKNIKKKPTYNKDVLVIIETRFGYTKDYIRKSIRGDRVGIIPDKIKAEYNKLNIESLKLINSMAQKFQNVQIK